MVIIATQRTKIVPFTEKHITNEYISWLNDKSLMRYSEQRHKEHSSETCSKYLRSFSSASNYFFAIEDLAQENKMLGTMTVYCDQNNSIADIGILIGDKNVQGKGYGLEAWVGVINWLLKEKKVRKITAGTLAVNKPMLSIMKKSGMSEDGVRRNHYIINDREEDVVYMAVFNSNGVFE